VARSLSGSFTTTVGQDLVPPAVVQQIASESSQCAGSGGAFYLSPSVRGRIPLPAGSAPSPAAPGCYKVANHTCMDRILPPAGDRKLDCTDDVTDLVTTVAPAGHGPVISSLDGVVNYGSPAAARGRFAPAPLVETVTWCVESTACTVILEAAQETGASAAVAGAAAASISWLLVIGGGILLGLAFFALYEILFPTAVNIAGLIEYPIHVTDNFDTFSDWGEDKGKWVSSLKMYAQVVKTTDELTADHNLPFSWGALEESHLRSTIDRACAVQQGKPTAFVGCGDGFAVYVPGGVNFRFKPMHQTGDHIVTAISNDQIANDPLRVQWFYPARSVNGDAARKKGYAPGWYDTAAFQPTGHGEPVQGPSADNAGLRRVPVLVDGPGGQPVGYPR
jgi:hypothetical protein